MESINKDILTIIKAYISDNYDFKIDNNVSKILNLGTAYRIGTILAYSLKKNYIYKEEKELDSVLLFNVARVEKLNKVRKHIEKTLENSNINFIFLKGATLAKYYKEDYLRYSNDIDLIVEKESYENARKILIDNGFSLFSSSANESSLVFNNDVVIDLHCMFTQNDEQTEELFKDVVFDSKHELSEEYKYIFLIYHASKHIRENYLPLQFLLDLYYLSKLDLDKEFVNNILFKMKLDKFNNTNLQLINYLLNGNNESSLMKDYISFLTNMANNKGLDNMVLARQGSGIVYVLKRAFPNYEEMCRLYPGVSKSRFLLPYYYVKRIIDRVAQGKTDRTLSEINVSLNMDKEKIIKTKQLFNELGL